MKTPHFKEEEGARVQAEQIGGRGAVGGRGGGPAVLTQQNLAELIPLPSSLSCSLLRPDSRLALRQKPAN